MEEVKIQRERWDETVGVYLLEKRDRYIVVAQLSPGIYGEAGRSLAGGGVPT